MLPLRDLRDAAAMRNSDMSSQTESRKILRYAASAALLLSLIVVAIGAYHSFLRGHLQPLVASAYALIVVSTIVLLVALHALDRET